MARETRSSLAARGSCHSRDQSQEGGASRWSLAIGLVVLFQALVRLGQLTEQLILEARY